MKIECRASIVRSLPATLLTICWLGANALSCSGAAKSQETTPQELPKSAPPSSKDEVDRGVSGGVGTTLKTKVNLVVVPVVVRDSSGHAVGDLQKENFQVFDNHKPQEIRQFTVEKAESRNSIDSFGGKSEKFVAPNRFTAIVFDDVHLTSENLPQLRAACLQLVSNGLVRTERVAIFTTSGKLTLDFTDDRAKLRDAMARLEPNPLPGSQTKECPDIGYYDANQILNRHDLGATEAAVSEAMTQCGIKDPRMAKSVVLAVSEKALNLGDVQTGLVLRALVAVLGRVSTLPGQRTVVLASPSFLVSDREHREYEVIDRAVKSHVVINTLDARGVSTDENEIADSNVLSEFADGTGGIFFHNNDLEEGVRRVAAAPELVYELIFSPKDLKYDGKFHHLKVTLVGKNKLAVSAREGYFAPRHLTDAAQAENSEISDALFSQDEIHELPIKMQTQFIRGDKPVAKLSVLTQVDLRELLHHQANGQNANELRIVAAVFDRNGNYMNAIDKTIAVHWSENNAGMRTAAKYDFILDSGDYLVRLVVRDSESQHLFARDEVVDIP